MHALHVVGGPVMQRRRRYTAGTTMLSALAVCISLGAGLDANLGAARAQTAEAEAQTSIPPEDQSWVSLGKGAPESFNARQVAAHYLSYAVMAGLTYERFDTGNPGKRNLMPEEAYWLKSLPEIREPNFTLGKGQIWTFADGWEGRQPCLAGDPDCRNPVGGLGVHFWTQQSKRGSGRCREAVIAFRGTKLWTWGSMYSNVGPLARFLLGPWVGADHYYQVRNHIDNWVEQLQKTRCVNVGTKFIAVGHSLGGGLAQHAAYWNSRISKVYTFNTSPVVALWEVEERYNKNVKDLEIDHVVVKDEFLAPFRASSDRRRGGPRTCNPQERTIKFDVVPGKPRARFQFWPPVSWERHEIWPLARQLYAWSRADKAGSRRLAALPAATHEDKIAHKCITESREKYQTRVAERGGLPPSAITVRPTPASRRGR